MSLLDSLPGLEMPVSEVPDALRDLWSQTEHGDDKTQPEDNYRAVQSNLILHLGLTTSHEEAREVLEHALKFAERYPCRIICLCPFERGDEQLLRGKLYSQCSISSGGGHPVCSEALMLGYSLNDSEFLEHQVSVWLESDLPTYHWFNRVPAERIRQSYMPFLKMVTRVTYDSSLEGTGDMCQVDWPCPRGARDLAETRLLHVRQALGQLLSGFPVETLINHLAEIKILHGKAMSGEARGLGNWLQDCLDCVEENQSIDIKREASDALSGLDCIWTYSGSGKAIRMKFSKDLCQGDVEINLGRGARVYPLRLKEPTKELTLAEALFF